MFTTLSRIDPRWFQIGSLAGLVVFATTQLHLDITPSIVAVILITAQLVQFACSRIFDSPYEFKSALISSLGLTLLLRTNEPVLAMAAAAIAISSKFLLRARGRHLFNPTAFGIGILLLVSDRVWLSPGQWGKAALLVFFVLMSGWLVVQRARRSDITVAFLLGYAAMLFGRAVWLGDPLAIPMHQLQSGTLLIFSFFMISDPRTTPNTRLGRILFALIVVAIGGVLRFGFYEPNALVWGLLLATPLVPILDVLLGGSEYQWNKVAEMPGGRLINKGAAVSIGLVLLVFGGSEVSQGFCGFYVAQADAKLFNKASQVVLARHEGKTVITMVNDYEGPLKEFAVVIPVPEVPKREEIRVVDKSIIDHLDAFTAPRMVEYFDRDPCSSYGEGEDNPLDISGSSSSYTPPPPPPPTPGGTYGVKIEAEYAIGEYDILILSALQSDGLESWLRDNHYRIPEGAERVLGSYIKQGMKFFVAKVNLERQSKEGFRMLRPLQVEYTSNKFMLPIRLGTVNAQGDQDLIIYGLSEKGRIETTNYRTVKVITDVNVPEYVGKEFGEFYKTMFTRQVEGYGGPIAVLEYAWAAGWCDPCASTPLPMGELQSLGATWQMAYHNKMDLYITRLHVRYNGEKFPEDLMLQETGDQSTFQGRYVITHPWRGNSTCEDADRYRRELRPRLEHEAYTVADLTGWNLDSITAKMDMPEPLPERHWWQLNRN